MNMAAGTAEPLLAELREEIEPRLAALRAPLAQCALSDYTFSNLFLFCHAHDYRYLPGEHPCIAGMTYDGTAHLLPLFDITTVAVETLRKMLGRTWCFYPVPSEWIARLDPAQFEWRAVRDDADYLFSAEQFITYESHDLRGKRGAMRRLLSQYRVTSEPISASTSADALQVLDGWCEDKRLKRQQADAGPCEQALSEDEMRMSLHGFIYYADAVPAGFVLTEMINPGVQVVRFAKGRARFDGIYPFMFHDMSRRGGCRWLNFEQDLGKPGFRRSKLSYLPCALLDKYRVTLRSAASARKSAG